MDGGQGNNPKDEQMNIAKEKCAIFNFAFIMTNTVNAEFVATQPT